jgi:hypothetical protein
MLAATGPAIAPFTIVLLTTSLCIALSVAVLRAVRRGAARVMRDSLVVRDGHPALSDDTRASLEKRGLSVTKIEQLVDKTYTVNDRGEIAPRGESTERGTPAPPTSGASSTTAEPDRPIYRKPSVEDLLGGPRK